MACEVVPNTQRMKSRAVRGFQARGHVDRRLNFGTKNMAVEATTGSDPDVALLGAQLGPEALGERGDDPLPQRARVLV
jgi:hypothetical protein